MAVPRLPPRRRHHSQRVAHPDQTEHARCRGGDRRAENRQPARGDRAGGKAHAPRGAAARDMSGSPRRVLILTASYGSAHTRAARILAAVVDHFLDLVHPAFDRWSRALYYGILHRAPAVWGGAYWLGDRINVGSPLLLGFNHVGARKLRQMLRAQHYDQVVSVQPTPAGALSFLRSRGERTPPHTTVFTDFVAHTQWIHPHVDRYCVPSEEISHELTARGLPRESVVVTGIPVAPDFLEQPDRAAARLSLGLSPRLPVLLFMDGSGGGFGRLEEATRTLLGMEEPLQAVMVTGRDERLETRLRELASARESRVKIF